MSKAAVAIEFNSYSPTEAEIALEQQAELEGKPKDHCGVWAMWDERNPHILDDAFVGAENVQHRGDGGAGAAAISPTTEGFTILRDAGRVIEVFGEDGIALKGALPADSHAVIVHSRWPTDAAMGDCNQPRAGELVAIGHNGQLQDKNKEYLSVKYDVTEYTTDSDLLTKVVDKVAMEICDGDVERALLHVLPELRGAFCLTVLTKDKLIAIRDRNGMRPFQLGRTETGGYIFTSENMAIDNVPGATWEREIKPAEMIVVDKHGMRSGQWGEADPAACLLEYIYLANKQTWLNGILIGAARRGFGREVAKRIPEHILRKLGALVPLPNGANQATHGTSEATGVPFVPLMKINPEYKNKRSFIQPNRVKQFAMAASKLLIDRIHIPFVQGKAIGVEDDSLIRSTTQKANVPKIWKEAKPSEIHLIIAAPQYVETCDLGVDTPNHEDLISVRTKGDTNKIAKEVNVNSVTYAELEDMFAVVGDKVCSFCLGGSKPNLGPRQDVEALKRKRSEVRELAGSPA